MKRDYRRWYSPSLGREMEVLVFGHEGLPAVVFPTSCSRFYEFEDRGMVASVADKIERGELQLFCVDSVDAESWYNRDVPPRWKIARQVQYERYVMDEVVPFVRMLNGNPLLATIGCSFGGYHAVNVALRHPDVFTACLSMSGAFDMTSFLWGYYDDDVYFQTPPHYMRNQNDGWYFERYRRNTYVLATGYDDQCWDSNEKLAHVLREKQIPVRLDVWSYHNAHDWPCWREMMRAYL
jgi:esterase/lipase superfamily enzyme